MIYFNRKNKEVEIPERVYYTEVRPNALAGSNSKCDALGHDWYLVDNGDGTGYFKCARCGETG